MIHRGSHEVITIGQNLSFVFLMSIFRHINADVRKRRWLKRAYASSKP